MDIWITLRRFVIVNALTLCYGGICSILVLISYVKSLFGSAQGNKLKLEPPACLTDSKYGVHKYIKVNNIKLHYVESGDPSKTLMIFLHGFPDFWYTWRHQIVHFKKDYWCVAVDMRGYGDSERPEATSAYKLKELIEDVRDLIRQLGREKCILVAHDWGGVIAFKFRDIYPENLNALLVLGSTDLETLTKVIWSNPAQKKKSWYIFYFRLPKLPELQLSDLAILDRLYKWPGEGSPTDEDLECYKYWFGKQNAFTPPLNYYRANFHYQLPNKTASKVNVPTLLVNAANDPYFTTTIVEEIKKAYVDMEAHILSEGNHFLHQGEPERINKLMTDFLQKQCI